MYMKRFEHEKSPSVYQQAGTGHLAPPVSATLPLVASSIMAIPAAANKNIPIQAPAANNSIPIQPPIKRRPERPQGTGKKPQPATDGVTPVKRRPGRPPGMKQKQPPTEAILQPTEAVLASQQMLVTKPPAKRRKSAPLKRMELSGVIAMLCSSAVDAKKQLTAPVGWADEHPVGAGICVKKLMNKGIHTFVGMVGYCLKDRHELHFRVCMRNITDAVQREGMMLYTFYVAADMKNRVELNPNNVMRRALQYNKYLNHHPLGTSFRGCLRCMVVDGHDTPSTTWLINKGLDRTRTAALWRCYIQPGAVTLSDIDQVFFWMPRIQPSLYIQTTVPGLQMLTADALGDMVDSDHGSPHPERVSGNAAAHEVTEFASFIPLVPGLEADQFDSSDVPLEGVASNCICCN
ncbi:hypothetical protein R1sor_004375 [Riccia sorocarpa]|uniref:Replitron HUH endonuclease domain-containing protein n=1 Tax=Riccia sorocarpa TaxID=122646 RepID=A0ABD3HMV2_9MARC